MASRILSALEHLDNTHQILDVLVTMKTTLATECPQSVGFTPATLAEVNDSIFHCDRRLSMPDHSRNVHSHAQDAGTPLQDETAKK